ncbi:MAG: M56 family metallopeptidase, partial [Clostridia bacterium]|nr:M56 family metallopeptidase [Clostridia bacterium]
MFGLFIAPAIVGTAAVLIFAVINKLTDRRFSAKWHYYMWLALLVVTVLPVRIDVNIPEKTVSGQNIVSDVPLDKTDIQPQNEIQPGIALENTALPATEEKVDITEYLPYVYTAGFVFTLFCRLTSYAAIRIKIRKHPDSDVGRKLKIRVKKCSFCQSPMLMGIIKPVLILPDRKLTETQLNSILAHEMVHFRRGDVAVKWLVMLIRSVHWYNPVIHFAAAKCDEYCELSCDADAVKGMDKKDETAYMMTILTLAAGKSYALGAGMSENGKILKRRFEMIKNKTEISRKTRILAFFCAL